MASCVPARSHLVKNQHKMDNTDRGYAVIINNKTFIEMEERTGTDNDREAMKELLISMGFQEDHIIVRNNCTREQMKETMSEAAEKYEDAYYDCFVGVILSHGDVYGNIVGTSENAISVGDLTEPFRGGNCKALSGKPKIFFIQISRGMRSDKGAQMTHRDDDSGHNECHELFVPSESEFLLAFSTVSGYNSSGQDENGMSLFIKTIVDVFKRDEQWKREDLLSMLTEVNKIIAFDYKIKIKGNKKSLKQMPCFVSMLTRKVIFSDKPKQGEK